MGKQKTYKLRDVVVEKDVTLQVRGISGSFVEIKVRALRKQERKQLFRAFQILEERLPEIVLPGDDAEVSREMVMGLAQRYCCFLVTSSRHIGAYSSLDDSFPAIILNKRLFDRRVCDEKEFAVTVLHELMHPFFVDKDKVADSKDEAIHDLLCYQLLGFEMPADHWALRVQEEKNE